VDKFVDEMVDKPPSSPGPMGLPLPSTGPASVLREGRNLRPVVSTGHPAVG